MPFFSIIIPVYNVAPYLRECLDSVLTQTFTDWEAICVDDGSTDGSGAILDEYAVKDKRFRVIHQTNAGVSAARNKALDEASGEWLSFLDSDDLLQEDFLVRLLDAARNANADLAIGGVLRFGGEGGDTLVGPSSDGLFSPEDLYVEYNSLCAWSWGKIYKRRLWDNVRFPAGIAYSEDRYVLHRVLYAYPKVPFVTGPLYRYRSRDDSAYGAEWNPVRVQRHLALEEQFCFFRKRGFVKAEVFTAGVSFNWLCTDIFHLGKVANPDTNLLEQLREKLRRQDREYWTQFARMLRKEQWNRFPSCYVMRTRIDAALSPNGKISSVKRFFNLWRYEGLYSILHKLLG